MDFAHNIGDTVFLKTDSQQLERIVTSIIIRPNQILFELSQDVNISSHYDFEISKEKDILKATT